MIESIVAKVLKQLKIEKDCSFTQADKYTYSLVYEGQKPRLMGERLIQELEIPLAAKAWAIYVEDVENYFVNLIIEKIR